MGLHIVGCAAVTDTSEETASSEASIVGGDDLPRLCQSMGWTAGFCATGWTGEYFANAYLAGTPSMIRGDQRIDFDWGHGGPIPGVVDEFSVRWTMTTALPRGRYVFTTEADDGVRLWVDDQLRIDHWQVTAPVVRQAAVDLADGLHVIRLEYFDRTLGATAKLRVDTDMAPFEPWVGQYFANPTLSGYPVLTRTDSSVSFDWGYGGPAPGLPSDYFSARWSRALTVQQAQTYVFTATTDDGIRLYLDGERLIDAWQIQGPTTYQVARTVPAGVHYLVAEYFENTGYATARIGVTPIAAPPPPPVDPWIACCESVRASTPSNNTCNADPIKCPNTKAVTRCHDKGDWQAGYYEAHAHCGTP